MSTDERRAHKRKRVLFGAKATAKGKARQLNCVIRNFSEAGACIEFGSVPALPDDIALTIARKGSAYTARVIWWRDTSAGVAFQSQSPSIVPDSDLEERLRASVRKMRQLRRRVRELSGEG